MNKTMKTAPELAELSEIEKAMRGKIDAVLPEFRDMELSQKVTSTQGELVLKANTRIQEARALFRDYAAIVKAKRDVENNVPEPAEISNLSDLRKRFKVAE